MYSRWKGKPASNSPAQGLLLLPNPSPCAVQHISEATSKQNPHCTWVKRLWACEGAHSVKQEKSRTNHGCAAYTLFLILQFMQVKYTMRFQTYLCLLRCNTQLHQFVNIVVFSICSLALWMPWLCFLNLQIQSALPVNTKALQCTPESLVFLEHKTFAKT